MAELTTPGGPFFDYFYVFVAGPTFSAYLLPIESFEANGLQSFFGALERSIGGTLYHSLADSMEYSSSVLWPPAQAGQSIIDFVTVPLPGLISRIFGRCRTDFLFNARASEAVGGGVIAWAA